MSNPRPGSGIQNEPAVGTTVTSTLPSAPTASLKLVSSSEGVGMRGRLPVSGVGWSVGLSVVSVVVAGLWPS